MSIIENLNWRYATKRMTGAKVPEEKLNNILEATRLSASSMGLQPYTILVISNEDVKKKLQAASYNQAQVVECSHLMVFCAWNGISETQINDYVNNIAKTRNVDASSLDGFKQNIMSSTSRMDQHAQYSWAARQAYIALGTALAAAAEEKVDCVGMEGFVPEQVDEVLGLGAKGLKSVAYVALGYRSEEDKTQFSEKVRREKAKLFEFID